MVVIPDQNMTTALSVGKKAFYQPRERKICSLELFVDLNVLDIEHILSTLRICVSDFYRLH